MDFRRGRRHRGACDPGIRVALRPFPNERIQRQNSSGGWQCRISLRPRTWRNSYPDFRLHTSHVFGGRQRGRTAFAQYRPCQRDRADGGVPPTLSRYIHPIRRTRHVGAKLSSLQKVLSHQPRNGFHLLPLLCSGGIKPCLHLQRPAHLHNSFL